MCDLPTIILIPFDTALAKDLAHGEPAAQAGPLEALGSAQGPLWLFVDWLLPTCSGLELCRRLRANPATADARISLVLEDDDRESRRRALKAGADDYCIGPLTAEGIRARACEAAPLIARRDKLLVHGLLRLDCEAYQVRMGSMPVPLRPTEFLLLAFLLENRDRVVSRRELIGALKGEAPVDERTVDVWIGRLRRALSQARLSDTIRTVRGVGYVYDSF